MQENEAVTYIKKAFEYKEHECYKQAIEMLYRVLETESDNIEVLYQLGELYVLLNNYNRAEQYLERVLELQPEHIASLKLLCTVYERQNELEKAVKLAKKAFELDKTSTSLKRLIKILGCLKQFKEIEIYRASKCLDSGCMSLWAQALYNAGKTLEAKELIEKACAADSENTDCKILLGKVYFDENNFKALTLDNKATEKIVYLTFDVGYDNGYTGIILDTLKEKNVPAAFFCTVDEMKSDPESIARMINEGHIVGNHTDTHPSMDELTRSQMTAEIKAFDDYIRTNYGYSSPYFRFPKGEYSDCALDLVGSLGYLSVFWSLAYADWDINNQKGADYALKTVTDRIHPGAVILLHAVSSDNAQALGDIIDTVRNMGYEFRSLEEYGK